MGVWARRAAVLATVVALSAGAFFGLTCLMISEFEKAVE